MQKQSCLLADIPQCTAPKKEKTPQVSPQILNKYVSQVPSDRRNVSETLAESLVTLLNPLPHQDKSPKPAPTSSARRKVDLLGCKVQRGGGQGCDARCLTGSPGEEKALTGSIFQFPWGRYTHYHQFQATNLMSPVYKNPEILTIGSHKSANSTE